MSIKETLAADVTTALKARDAVRVSTLRMALAAITNAEKSGKAERTLTDDEIVGVLSTEAKKRREAATAFADGGRAEAAEKELAEAAIITEYLPAQLDDAEIDALVAEAVAATGAASPGEMGKVMGWLAPRIKGKADGAVVSAKVKAALAG